MTVEFHPAARNELIADAAYDEQQVPGLGDSFVVELESVAALLETHPELGAVMEPPFRHLPLHKFPHSLICVAAASRIQIVAVAHQKRRPGYWRDRLTGGR